MAARLKRQLAEARGGKLQFPAVPRWTGNTDRTMTLKPLAVRLVRVGRAK